MDSRDVETAIAGVAGRTPGVVSVYLFGSVAEGREHRESDVDVGVLLDRGTYPSTAERFEARLSLIAQLSAAVLRDADVVILNDAPPLLARAIIRGPRVYCADEESDHAFFRTALLLAADIDPWMQRMWRIKLAAGRT